MSWWRNWRSICRKKCKRHFCKSEYFQMIYGDKREENAKDDRENIFKIKDEYRFLGDY